MRFSLGESPGVEPPLQGHDHPDGGRSPGEKDLAVVDAADAVHRPAVVALEGAPRRLRVSPEGAVHPTLADGVAPEQEHGLDAGNLLARVAAGHAPQAFPDLAAKSPSTVAPHAFWAALTHARFDALPGWSSSAIPAPYSTLSQCCTSITVSMAPVGAVGWFGAGAAPPPTSAARMASAILAGVDAL